MARTWEWKVRLRFLARWGNVVAVYAYLSFGGDVRAHAHLAVVRNTAEVAVFYARGFEGAGTDNVGSFAGDAFDVFVGGILCCLLVVHTVGCWC